MTTTRIGEFDAEWAEYLTVQGRADVRLVNNGTFRNFPLTDPEFALVEASGIFIRPERPTAFHNIWDGEKWVLNVEQKERSDAISKVAELEAEVTQTRLIEGALGVDGGWLAAQYAKIQQERAKIGE